MTRSVSSNIFAFDEAVSFIDHRGKIRTSDHFYCALFKGEKFHYGYKGSCDLVYFTNYTKGSCAPGTVILLDGFEKYLRELVRRQVQLVRNCVVDFHIEEAVQVSLPTVPYVPNREAVRHGQCPWAKLPSGFEAYVTGNKLEHLKISDTWVLVPTGHMFTDHYFVLPGGLSAWSLIKAVNRLLEKTPTT